MDIPDRSTILSRVFVPTEGINGWPHLETYPDGYPEELFCESERKRLGRYFRLIVEADALGLDNVQKDVVIFLDLYRTDAFYSFPGEHSSKNKPPFMVKRLVRTKEFDDLVAVFSWLRRAGYPWTWFYAAAWTIGGVVRTVPTDVLNNIVATKGTSAGVSYPSLKQLIGDRFLRLFKADASRFDIMDMNNSVARRVYRDFWERERYVLGRGLDYYEAVASNMGYDKWYEPLINNYGLLVYEMTNNQEMICPIIRSCPEIVDRIEGKLDVSVDFFISEKTESIKTGVSCREKALHVVKSFGSDVVEAYMAYHAACLSLGVARG